MNLRNKKTGEVGYLIVGKGIDYCIVTNDDWEDCGKYNSLAELNTEWEDYEEPKDYYAIDACGEVDTTNMDPDDELAKQMQSIGNYFETKEEAEKAVEKLKAWKRLKDKGFEFIDFDWKNGTISFEESPIKDGEESDEFWEDLDLLFGGGDD